MFGSTELSTTDPLPPAFRSLWRTFRLGYRAEPRLLVWSLVMVLFTALPDALVALWLKFLADGVAQANQAWILTAAIGLAISATLTWYLSVVFDRLQRHFRDRLSIALEAHVARLLASIATIEHHERPEYLDRLQVLRDHVFALEHLFSAVFTTLGWVLRLAVALVLLASVHPALLSLIVFALPTLAVASWRPAVERAVEERSAPHHRLARHLFLLGTTASPAKELRVMRIGELLGGLRRAAWERWYAAMSRTTWHSALWNALVWTGFAVGFTGALAFVAIVLHRPAGSVLLVLVAASQLSRYLGAVAGELVFLRGIWLDSARRLTWLEDYAAATTNLRDAELPATLRGIRLEGVSFCYPGSDKLVLDTVDLELPAGRVIAIVGENGAGKSTLVKLLCGMYAPTKGRISVDGVSLATLPVAGWRERLAGAFQDFFRFEFRVQQSVGLGELARMEARPAVETALERGGAQAVVAQLTHGLDTQLGATWENGHDLSFGQWQKLALARGLMRDAPLLLVFDEPTAALDAETEHALFERFAAAARDASLTGRITLLVSHRFSTVRMADLIVVMDGARVVELGDHEALMDRRGKYAELYSIQAKSFR